MERGGGGGSLELAGGGGGVGGNSDLCLQDLVTGSATGLSVQHYQHAAAAASMAGLHGDHLQNAMHHHDVHGNSHHDTSMLHNPNHQLAHEPLEKLKCKFCHFKLLPKIIVGKKFLSFFFFFHIIS